MSRYYICHRTPPPIGERVQIFIADHEHKWSYGTWDGERWDIDSREVFDDLDPEEITHWAPEQASPFDLVVPPEVFDAGELLEHEPIPEHWKIEAPPRQIEAPPPRRIKKKKS